MADKGAGITSAAIIGGFLCLGLLFVAIAATIILSLIPVFTANHSDEGYGSVYAIDAMMLKMIYANISAQFNGSIIANSTDLSQRCTKFLQSKGYKNVAGCLLYNGVSWAPYNTSTSNRRRRRATSVGGYDILSAIVAYTTSCPSGSDTNRTENNTRTSYCVNQTLVQCNSLVNDDGTTFSQWSPNGLVVEALATDGVYRQIPIDQLYGVPRSIAAAIAQLLPGVSSDVIGSLQRGCRYVGKRSIADINTLLASQTGSNVTTDATTAPSS